MNNALAWHIYAEQLYHHGYGYPLWMPDPDPTSSEVHIGDVGWVKNGGFMQLFNAMKESGDPQLRNAVPNDYTPFNPPNLIISGPTEVIVQPLLCSRTIKEVEVSGGASAGGGLPLPAASASAAGNFSFKCAADSGAFLLFSPSAHSTEIESKRHIVNYMRENFAHWFDMAETFGLDLREEDIWFVCGTTKTNKWAVAAFNGNYRRKVGSVAADLGSLAGLNLSVSISNEMIPQSYYRIGPRRRQQTSTALVHSESHQEEPEEDAEATQCIFIHYYKMRRRMWSAKPIRAAAGPHELPPPGPDDMEIDQVTEAGVEYVADDEFEQVPRREKGFDPVSDLLEYILQNSEATVAIASDRDVLALFKEGEFPDDVARALVDLRPSIELDEHGVGTVSVAIDYTKKRRLDEGENQTEPLQNATAPIDGVSAENNDTRPPAAAQTDAKMDDSDDDDDDHDKVIKRVGPQGATSSHEGSVTALAYSANSRFAASGSEDTSIIFWDVQAGMVMYKRLGHSDTISSLAFSPGNDVLASGSNDSVIILWNVRGGNELRRLLTTVPIHSLAFSPDGTKLIAGAYDGSLRIWDTQDWEAPPRQVKKNMAVVTFIIFSPDGRLMATGGTESECLVWDLSQLGTGEPKSALKGHKGMVCDAAFAPDNRRIATASDDGTSVVWNAETGEALLVLGEHTGPVWSVAFSPDGRAVASGSSDATVKVCDSFSGARLLSLDGHDSMVNEVAFSPGGRFVASASSDNTVRLWSATDGGCLATFNEHNDNVTAVLFSPDDGTIASGSHDGTVYIHSLVSA